MDGRKLSSSDAPLVQSFIWLPKQIDTICLGISTSALSRLLEPHVAAGTYYRRLDWFATHVTSVIPYVKFSNSVWRGKIWACFVKALKSWLRYYEAIIQKMLSNCERMVCDLKTGLIHITDKLHFLTERIK